MIRNQKSHNLFGKDSSAGDGERVSREEALRVATINNAYLTFEEDVKGSIEPGKLADFLILSQDILTVPEEEIRALHPFETYAPGSPIYPIRRCTVS